MKLVRASLCAGENPQHRFHRRGGAVKHVQAYLCKGNTLQRRFNRRGDAGKHVQACLSARKDREAVFTTVEVQ